MGTALKFRQLLHRGMVKLMFILFNVVLMQGYNIAAHFYPFYAAQQGVMKEQVPVLFDIVNMVHDHTHKTGQVDSTLEELDNLSMDMGIYLKVEQDHALISAIRLHFPTDLVLSRLLPV